MVWRSRSWRVKSELQWPQAEAADCRVAPHDEQRTTDAECGRGAGISISSPQWQWNRSPGSRPVASYWRLHTGQATRWRMVVFDCTARRRSRFVAMGHGSTRIDWIGTDHRNRGSRRSRSRSDRHHPAGFAPNRASGNSPAFVILNIAMESVPSCLCGSNTPLSSALSVHAGEPLRWVWANT